MSKYSFENPEYQADGTFVNHHYVYEGDAVVGWKIYRDDSLHLELGPGYQIVQTKYCGVCSTDLARRFLPYPLPQIIGHEVVGTIQQKQEEGKEQEQEQQQAVCIEINASEYAREVHTGKNPYDDASMHTHDPLRITLGINQLPGGFSPFVLAPIHAVVPVPSSVSLETAALTEPFAAALQGVEATLPRPNERVAVLGPRRLGALILAALDGFRKSRQMNFSITALVRHDRLLELSQQLGADEAIDLRTTGIETLRKQYDVVFDTTGKPEGVALAIQLAKRVVHLKSTNGQTVQGLAHLTDLVVDEMALLPYSLEHLNFGWPLESEPRRNLNVFVTPNVSSEVVQGIVATNRKVIQAEIGITHSQLVAQGLLDGGDMVAGSPFPRFDLAVASSLQEVDQILRPVPSEEVSLVRARGAILLVDNNKEEETKSNTTSSGGTSALWDEIVGSGLQLHSSRCGNFTRALQILDENPIIAKRLQETMITHTFDLHDIAKAFDVASDSSQSIKVLVKTNK